MATRLTQQRAEALRQVPLFHGCTEIQLALIDTLVDEIEVESGEVLTREEQPPLEAFIVVSGSADLIVKGEAMATLGPGSLFGSLGVLGPRQPWVATVVARTPMRLIVVTGDGLAELLGIDGVARGVAGDQPDAPPAGMSDTAQAGRAAMPDWERE